jgi:hypothetical protein
VLSGFASVSKLTVVSCSQTPPCHSPRVLNNTSAGTSWDITTNDELREQAGALFSRCVVSEFSQHTGNKFVPMFRRNLSPPYSE